MKPVHVSDHAVLRYLERFAGIDTEAVRKMIEEKAAAAVKAGALSLKIDGVVFLMKGNTVTTCLTSEMRNNQREKQARIYGEARRK